MNSPTDRQKDAFREYSFTHITLMSDKNIILKNSIYILHIYITDLYVHIFKYSYFSGNPYKAAWFERKKLLCAKLGNLYAYKCVLKLWLLQGRSQQFSLVGRGGVSKSHEL